MKKNIWIGVLLVAVVALAALVGFQSQQIVELKEQEQRMVELDREMAKAARAPAPAPVEEAPAVETKTVEPVAESAPIPPAATAGGTTNNPMSALAEMMKNPQMKEMIRAQQKVGLTAMYGGLNKYLNISTNDMDALNQLLLDRQMAMTDAGMSMMGGSGTDAKQAAEDAKTIKADYDKKIADLLGPEAYPVFQDYEKSARGPDVGADVPEFVAAGSGVDGPAGGELDRGDGR